MATAIAREKELVQALSILTITPERADTAAHLIGSLEDREWNDFVSLADSHHVVVRAFRALAPAVQSDSLLQQRIATALQAERGRIDNALQCLENVCRELETAGCPVVVMKSLDHWPDLGNDLDLYTTAPEHDVVRVFTEKLGATIEPRSWGDRLAHKWNFAIPGLRESVEVHSERLGQTGEHIALARRFISRRMAQQIENHTFLVPAPEERIVVATLQRMYRHFYFRVCDIVNSGGLVESGALNFRELRTTSDLGGIWPGVATCLKIVSDYLARYRGIGLNLPADVMRSARFGGEKLYVQRRFLRVPIMPDGAGLYTKQVAATAMRGDVPATFRLTLLPPLASVAAVAFRVTGDDKGIW
ncbi:MAG TPA: nucleotidyltransferase family protein [Terriglobales bacterium]|nr:nucleotidyltransferase family protein [Terriglobales bacterium]